VTVRFNGRRVVFAHCDRCESRGIVELISFRRFLYCSEAGRAWSFWSEDANCIVLPFIARLLLDRDSALCTTPRHVPRSPARNFAFL